MSRPAKVVHIFCDDVDLGGEWAFALRIGCGYHTAVLPVGAWLRNRRIRPDARMLIEPAKKRVTVAGASRLEAQCVSLEDRPAVFEAVAWAAQRKRGPKRAILDGLPPKKPPVSDYKPAMIVH